MWSSSESTLSATTPSGPQNLEQGTLNTAATVIIIIVVLAFVVLAAALVGILARKYRKRRYRYYPAFKHRILEEDDSNFSQTGTIARFGKLRPSEWLSLIIDCVCVFFSNVHRQCALFKLH